MRSIPLAPFLGLFLVYLLNANFAFGAPIDCRTTTLKSGTSYECVAGTERRFLLYLPKHFQPQKAIPVVLNLHGGGATPENFNEMTGMQTFAEQRGFVLVTPAGINTVWNAGSCCDTAAAQNQNVDDIGFLSTILDQIEALFIVDKRRIFALGFSNGAMMAHRVGCELSHRITGIAPISGGLQDTNEKEEEVFKCQPRRAISVIEINGKPEKGSLLLGADSCAPFAGGETTRPDAITKFRRSIQESFDFWKNGQTCTAAPQAKVLGSGPGRYECVEYEGCQSGTATALCTIPNGAHWFPGALTTQPASVARVCGRGVSSALSGAQVALDFLFNHAK